MAEPGERMGRRALDLTRAMFDRDRIPSRTGTPIAGFDEGGVAFADGTRLDADLVLFIPGVAGHPVLAASDLPLNEAGFVRIDDHGLVEGTADVYAAGDVAALEGPEWRAKQGHTAEVMARNAAFNIVAAETGRPERQGYQGAPLDRVPHGHGRRGRDGLPRPDPERRRPAAGRRPLDEARLGRLRPARPSSAACEDCPASRRDVSIRPPISSTE